VHGPTENKSDDTRESFYERLQCVSDQFPEYHMKILQNSKAKVREKIFSNQQSGIIFYME
jgi:hypothetical protein